MTRVNSESGKEAQSAPAAAQRSVVRQQEIQEVFEIVGLRKGNGQLLQQRFQILLGRLLAVKTHLIMKRFVSRGEYFGGSKVVLRLAYPGAGAPFHRGFCPSS